MMISTEYIILVLLSLFAIIKKDDKYLCYSVIAYMVVLGMMRGLNVGTDHFGYQDDFNLIHSYHSMNLIRHDFEFGYFSSILFFKEFSNDYLTFASLAIPPTIIGIVMFFRKHTIPMSYALFFYVILGLYFCSYNIMRQMLAISLILANIGKLYKQKYFQFAAVITIIAMLFHRSTLLMLLLIPIYICSKKSVTINKKKLAFIVFFCYLFSFVGKKVIGNTLLGIIQSTPLAKFDTYIVGWDENISNTTSTMFMLYTLIYLYVVEKTKNIFVSYCFITFTILYNIFSMFTSQSGRIAYPFMFFWIIGISQSLCSKKSQKRNVFVFVTFIFSFGYFIYNYIINNIGEINPYYWR